jgi:DNA-directed RNA polymerase specialized sigma24 family protein
MLLERETEFEALYRAHFRHVYHYILRRIGDRETAQEPAADVFRIAWYRQDGLEGAAIPWLLGVARNVLGNEYRGRKRRQELQLRLKDYAMNNAPQAGELPMPLSRGWDAWR